MASNPYGNLFALHNGVVRSGMGSYGGQSPFPGQASPVMGSLGSQQPTQPQQMPGSASPIQGGLGSYGPVNMPAQPVGPQQWGGYGSGLGIAAHPVMGGLGSYGGGWGGGGGLNNAYANPIQSGMGHMGGYPPAHAVGPAGYGGGVNLSNLMMLRRGAY